MAHLAITKKRLAIPGGSLTPLDPCEVNPVCCVPCGGLELPSIFYATFHGIPAACLSPPASRCDLFTNGRQWTRILLNQTYRLKYATSTQGSTLCADGGVTHHYFLDVSPQFVPPPGIFSGPLFVTLLGSETCASSDGPETVSFYMGLALRVHCCNSPAGEPGGGGLSWELLTSLVIYGAGPPLTVYQEDLFFGALDDAGTWVTYSGPVGGGEGNVNYATSSWTAPPFESYNIGVSFPLLPACDPTGLALVDITP